MLKCLSDNVFNGDCLINCLNCDSLSVLAYQLGAHKIPVIPIYRLLGKIVYYYSKIDCKDGVFFF